MHVETASGAQHLLRAARDAALPDAEIERRVAAKNAVVARALRERRISLREAEDLLYDPELRDQLAQLRPGCTLALRILDLGCSLATLEERLLKWSPEYPRLVEERTALLVAMGDRVLAPEALISAFRRRPALSPEELELAVPLADARLLPVLLRTLRAETSSWPEAARAALQERALGALATLEPACRSSARSWRLWWQREGRFAYPDPVDAMPDRPTALPAPVVLLPEGGGEYALDPPLPFYYVGRERGRAAIFLLQPAVRAQANWRSRLTEAVEALLAGSAPAPGEFAGTCGLEGARVHRTAPGEGIRVAIPDPGRRIAWLICSQCGQGAYVRYALVAEELPPGSIV
jgi:hypothetical protein